VRERDGGRKRKSESESERASERERDLPSPPLPLTYSHTRHTHRRRSGRVSLRELAAAASAPRADFAPFSRWATTMESEKAPIESDMAPTALCQEAILFLK